MKNFWLHGIYLSIIGILCFQLWSKTAATRVAFEQVNKVLINNCELLDIDSKSLFYQIERNKEINPHIYEPIFLEAKQTKESTESANNFIEKLIIKTQNNEKLNLKEVKDSIFIFSKQLTGLKDKEDSISLVKRCLILKTIENDTFWNGFKVNQAAYLYFLKNQFLIDEIRYLYYHMDKVSSEIDVRNGIGISILPKQAILIEGETFEADIFIAKYATIYSEQNLTFISNNQNLPIREGFAHYSNIENSKGLKTLKIKALIRNPRTGEKLILNQEFEYHVLPKCSKNCQ